MAKICLFCETHEAEWKLESASVCVLFVYHEVFPVDNASCKWFYSFEYLTENQEMIPL